MQPKRILISILVVILLTFCTITAFAANAAEPTLEFSVSATTDTGLNAVEGVVLGAGDVVEISVTAGKWNGEALQAGQFSLTYDADALELTDAKVPEGYAFINLASQGELKVMTDSFDADEVLLVATLRAKAGAHASVTVSLDDVVVGAVVEGLNFPEPIAVRADDTVAVHVHEVAAGVVVPGCVTEGYTKHACTVIGCDFFAKTNVTPAIGSHDWSGQVDCKTKLICAREGCGEVLSEEGFCKAAPNNNPCEKDTVCEFCGTVLFKAHGAHDASGADATCTTDKVCARAGCTVVLQAKLGHVSSANANCDNALTCTRCDIVLAPALGHKAKSSATCTEDSVCINCGKVLAEATGHKYENAANCTTAKVCATCGVVATPALGHNFGAWELTEAATRKTAGIETRACLVCGVTETREVAFDGMPVWGILLIIFGALLVVAAALFALYWFVLKKKIKAAGGFAAYFAPVWQKVKAFFAKIFKKKSKKTTKIESEEETVVPEVVEEAPVAEEIAESTEDKE